MSPTVFWFKKYRFFFNSREETRRHVHIATPSGTAKFWLEPNVSIADYYLLSSSELKDIQKIVEDHKNDFINEWNKHFNQ